MIEVGPAKADLAKSHMVARRNLRAGTRPARRHTSLADDISGFGILVVTAAVLVIGVPLLFVLDMAGGGGLIVVPLLVALFLVIVGRTRIDDHGPWCGKVGPYRRRQIRLTIRGMRMFAMCRNCGRSLAASHGLCRLCLVRRIPQRRIQRNLTTKSKR